MQQNTVRTPCVCVHSQPSLGGRPTRRTRAKPKTVAHNLGSKRGWGRCVAVAQVGTYDLRRTPESGSHRASSNPSRILRSDVNVVCFPQDIAPELSALGEHIEEYWTEVPRLNWWWKVRLCTKDPQLRTGGMGPLALAANAVGCASGDVSGAGESKGLTQQIGPANVPLLHARFRQLGAQRIAQVDEAVAADVTALVRHMETMLEDKYVDVYFNLLIGESHANYWHVDSGVTLRLLRTYLGPGTQWFPISNRTEWADDAVTVLQQLGEDGGGGATWQLEGAVDLVARKPRQSVLDEGMNNGIGATRQRGHAGEISPDCNCATEAAAERAGRGHEQRHRCDPSKGPRGRDLT